MKKFSLIALSIIFISLSACKKEKETTDDPKPAKLTVHTTIDGSGPQAGTQIHFSYKVLMTKSKVLMRKEMLFLRI